MEGIENEIGSEDKIKPDEYDKAKIWRGHEITHLGDYSLVWRTRRGPNEVFKKMV